MGEHDRLTDPANSVAEDHAAADQMPWTQGLTIREYACIQLRQPETGIDELDDLIRKAKRDELAAKAMQAQIQHPSEACFDRESPGALRWNGDKLARHSYALADHMLAAREGGAS